MRTRRHHDVAHAELFIVRDGRDVPLGWFGHGRRCDVGLIGELARIQLAARRLGWSIRLGRASPELAELLALTGLGEVLGTETAPSAPIDLASRSATKAYGAESEGSSDRDPALGAGRAGRKDDHMVVRTVTRAQVLRFRLRQHSLIRGAETGTALTQLTLLDYGVQDTGADGAGWALAIRGAPSASLEGLSFAWTLRGAPHAYRRSDLAGVAAATAPLSETDAGKRIFDAVKPLRAAGIAALDALRVVADHLGEIVAAPIPKGEASGRLTELLDEPYLRFCRSCGTTHVYEMPFRLAALQAGLELEPGTSPPLLRPIAGGRPNLYRRLGGEAEEPFDVIRNYLRFYGPARVRDIAAFLDAPVKDVKAHWPSDALEVVVTDTHPGVGPQPRFVLAGDLDELTRVDGQTVNPRVLLAGPYDPYLQLRDRELLVAEEARRKDMWRVLGRPGAVVADGEIVGTWRTSTSGGRLTVRTAPWRPLHRWERTTVEEQAERLAAHRGVVLAKVVEP